MVSRGHLDSWTLHLSLSGEGRYKPLWVGKVKSMSKNAEGCHMATPEEEAKIEALLSDARAEYLQSWRERLLGMRTQIDGLLKEIEDFEHALA